MPLIKLSFYEHFMDPRARRSGGPSILFSADMYTYLYTYFQRFASIELCEFMDIYVQDTCQTCSNSIVEIILSVNYFYFSSLENIYSQVLK